jgi:hypothetical protein
MEIVCIRETTKVKFNLFASYLSGFESKNQIFHRFSKVDSNNIENHHFLEFFEVFVVGVVVEW